MRNILSVVFAAFFFPSAALAQIAISEDGVTFPDATKPVTALKQYEIGDVGPAGGWVFYVTADGLHGLEAAPVDQGRVEWGCIGTNMPGAQGTAIGTGARNTDEIFPYGCFSLVSIAAGLAAEYVSPSDYFDWYLPSKDELDLMYDNIGPGAAEPNTNVGGCAIDFYWSSSELNGYFAWNQYFDNGYQLDVNKNVTNRVRAVRAF